MTEMSQAAIAPRQPNISPKALTHPLFPIYRHYRSSMNTLLVEASSFEDWLYQYERNLRDEETVKHPRMGEFRQWMTVNKGGARRCPAGCFPHNFNYWLEGGRW